MAYLRNTKAPASAPGGHTWDDPDHVVDVENELAAVLLRIQDSGFVEVLPGNPGHPGLDEPDLERSEIVEAPARTRKRTSGKERASSSEITELGF